ncbi:hypothetical protein [Fibrobacter sp. UWB7]|uniref:hypothetical protein n=1 Tax=Fibrobacter sp. UWB7 TaxID=1896206 RepID=UPI00092410B7|nr:hypothetical protein [Fibrobacter sp. UWB7]SHM72514.1 hypothetical protein SAMN05720467_2121 [Fibrobacter sp. UWB7]
MNELNKDMLVVVKDAVAESYNNHTMVGVDPKLHNVDVVKLDDLKKPKFIDVSGVEIDPEVDKAYLRAKYFDEPDVYYEATFDSINRMNRERFNMFKHVAHILGATMITKMNVQEDEMNHGFRFHLGSGGGKVNESDKKVQGNAKTPKFEIKADFENESSDQKKGALNLNIQSLIQEKLNRGFLQYEVFETKEYNEQRWEKAKEFLIKNRLYYNEDFRALLESRNPENGLKKFDFIQYQISSDLSKYLTLAAAIDVSGIISRATSASASVAAPMSIVSGGIATVLSGIFGFDIGLNADFKSQIQKFKIESDLLVMGFEHYDACFDELDKIIEQYKKTKNLFGDGRLEKQSVAAQLLDKNLTIGDVSTIAKLPVDEIQKIKERMGKK